MGYAPPSPPPRIAGTTKWSPLRSGALDKASSVVSEGVTASSRRMFASSIVWAVGGMCSVSSAVRIAYWSRMWLSLPFQTRQLLLGQSEAREMGDVLDIGTGIARPCPG